MAFGLPAVADAIAVVVEKPGASSENVAQLQEESSQ
jgi:hypothetical protein